MKALFLLLPLIALPGCAVLQSSYDQEAVDQCRELPNSNDRIACERQARDDARDRRADRLREK